MAELSSINVTIGADTSRVDTATKSIVSSINSMVRKIGQANLEGIIKGDPLSAVNKSIREAQNVLKHYTSEWSGSLSNINQHLDKYTRASINNLQKVGTALDSVMTKQKLFSQTGAQGSLQQFQNQNINAEAFKKTGKASPTAYLRKDLLETLKILREKYPEVKKVIDTFLKGVEAGTEKTKQEVKKDLEILYKGISSQAKIAEKELAGFGKRLQRATTQQGRIEFLGKLSAVKDETAALKRKDQALRESYITEAKARTEAKLGINVAQNRLVILSELEKRQRLGKKLTQDQTIELKNLRKAYNQLNAEAQGTKPSGFLSPQWFKQRLGWFIQLRAFWEAWRLTVESFREAFAFEQSMQNVKAIAQTTTEQFELLRQRALEVGTTTKYSAREAADAMVVMAQAGLATDEIFNSIKHTANLATATLFDLKDTAKLVTTIMRAWNIESEDSQRIVDVLATSINKTKLNMEDLGTSFNYITGVAPQLNLTLEETVAMLGTMANRGIKASTAATSLRAILSALLKPTDSFREQVHKLGLTMDQVNPELYNVNTIFKTMKDAGWGAAESFRAFRRRAASGATVLIQSADSLRDLSSEMNEFGRASSMAETQLDTVQNQWKLFKDEAVKLAATLNEDSTPAIISVIKTIKELLKVLYLLKPVLIAVGMIFEGWGYIFTFLNKGIAGLNADALDKRIKNATTLLVDNKKEIQRTIEKYRTFSQVYEKYTEAVAKGKKYGGKIQLDQEERALEYAKKAKLITESEIKAIQNNNTKAEARRIIENRINTAYVKREQLLANDYAEQKKSLKLSIKTHEALVGAKGRAVSSDFDKIAGKYDEIKKKGEDLTKASIGLKTVLFGIVEPSEVSKLEKAGKEFEDFYKDLTDIEKTYYIESGKEAEKKVKALRIVWAEGVTWAKAWERVTSQKSTVDNVKKDLSALGELRKDAGIVTSSPGEEPYVEEKETNKEQLNLIKVRYKELEAYKKRDIELSKDANVSKVKTLKLELDLLNIKKSQLLEEKSVLDQDRRENATEIRDKLIEIYNTETEINLKQAELARSSSVWLETVHQIHSEIKSSNQVWSSLAKDSIQGLSGTISKGLVGLATGFPEQKQKAEELKVELDGLKKEYKEALGEGRIEDAKELKDQMGELKDNISDLEDPLKNVGNRFKEFFRGIIEKAQETIEELLAMELVTWAIGGSKEQGSIGQGSGLLGSVFSGVSSAVGSLFKGDGGITPSIKAFRSFSSGGLTGSPTMAFLGDNPSNKELVIPSENISTNRVEGYSREKSSEQPINIINVMTQEDVVQAMASVKGERLVVNMIGRDINSRGPIWKQIKST